MRTFMFLLTAQGCASGQVELTSPPTTTAYILRHAEKVDATPDAALSDAGHRRAALLATLLADVPLTGVHSTDFHRTRDTVAVAAQHHKLEVSLYAPDAPDDLARGVLAAGGHHLIAGHSNTVPGLLAAFDVERPADLPETEFDRLYIVITNGVGTPAHTLLRYGSNL